jgi:hypothetical protein
MSVYVRLSRLIQQTVNPGVTLAAWEAVSANSDVT